MELEYEMSYEDSKGTLLESTMLQEYWILLMFKISVFAMITLNELMELFRFKYPLLLASDINAKSTISFAEPVTGAEEYIWHSLVSVVFDSESYAITVNT